MKNKKVVSLRTKAEVIFVAGFFIALSALSVMSITRTITDSSDTVYTYITNSNGNYWAVDGTADDVQIQAAMDDVEPRGAVWIPEGIFDLADDIDIVTGVDVTGVGMNATYLKMSGTPGDNRYGIKISSGTPHNFSIQDLTVDADEQDFYSCIYLASATDVLIQNVHVKGASSSNFYCEENVNRMTVDNLHSTGMGKYGARDPKQAMTFSKVFDSSFDNLYAYDCDLVTSFLDWGACDNITASNIYIDAEGTPVDAAGLKVAATSANPSQNMNFNNINIKNIVGDSATNGRAMFIEGAVSDSNFNNIAIHNGGSFYVGQGSSPILTKRININNLIINNTIDDTADAYGIQVLNAEEINFNNVITKYCYGRQLRMDNSNNITITNGKFFGGKYASMILQCKDITLDTCTFTENLNTNRVVELQSSTNFSLINCNFLNNVGDAIATNYGTGCSNYSITHTLFRGNAKAVDTHANDESFIITDNICWGDTIDDNTGDVTKIIEDNIGDSSDDTIYAQLSSSADQSFAATGTGYNITFNTNDGINGITHSTTVEPQNITIVTSGVYSIFAQPQVHAGAGASGYFHMWLRKDTGSGFADVANSNVELVLASNDEDVIPLIAVISLNAGDVIRVNASVAHTDIELDAQTPANEPAIPSIIFSMYRIGS